MIKIFLETSVFIRFFTQDDPEKGEKCTQLFRMIEQGKARPYTSNIVLMEIIYILIKVYHYPKQEVVKDVSRALSLRNLILVEKTNTKMALNYFKNYSIKYGDCLIATQIPPKVTLITYDSDFSKIPSLILATPEILIKKLNST